MNKLRYLYRIVQLKNGSYVAQYAERRIFGFLNYWQDITGNVADLEYCKKVIKESYDDDMRRLKSREGKKVQTIINYDPSK